MEQSFRPKLALNNIEFLCLKVYAHPGKSARWYLRELHRYRFGVPGKGSFGAMYFSPRGRYRNVTFVDAAKKSKAYYTFLGEAKCSTVGKIYLTVDGERRALAAAKKIGIVLNPCEVES